MIRLVCIFIDFDITFSEVFYITFFLISLQFRKDNFLSKYLVYNDIEI